MKTKSSQPKQTTPEQRLKTYASFGYNEPTDDLSKVKFPQFKIVVPTVEDKGQIQAALEHIHDSNVNPDFVAVNALMHGYQDLPTQPGPVVVNPHLFSQITNAKPTVFLVELRTDRGNHFEMDTVAVCTTLEKARAWIKASAKAKLLIKDLPVNLKSWFAICSQTVDAPIEDFGVDTNLLETYSISGKNLQGNQP